MRAVGEALALTFMWITKRKQLQ
ncbi:hypothetical protein ACFQ3J_11495 [Paenibacillus provencensis]|uniref:Uncharacterized protein n=1 Tax=Paenibacillus provencensis TaxID=441151 RepID=A0ABW3PT53_9BACL